jgi:LPXTG-motif cell wall-anchored protein
VARALLSLLGENAGLKAVPRWAVRMEGHDSRRKGKTMNLLILIVVLVLLFGGGGLYWRRRR